MKKKLYRLLGVQRFATLNPFFMVRFFIAILNVPYWSSVRMYMLDSNKNIRPFQSKFSKK